MIDDILEFNKKFVESKGYEKYITNKYPDKKIAILSCMDTRLTELLPAALGIRNGDVKIIKNAGGVISHPFGSVIRSLMVAIYELGVKEVMVVAHSDCGACHMNSNGCSIIARTVPFTDFSVSSKPSSHAPKSTPQKRIISMVSCLMPRAFMCSIISLLFM